MLHIRSSYLKYYLFLYLCAVLFVLPQHSQAISFSPQESQKGSQKGSQEDSHKQEESELQLDQPAQLDQLDKLGQQGQMDQRHLLKKNLIQRKTTQALNEFKKMSASARKKITAMSLGVLLQYQVMRSYLNSNESIKDTFPLRNVNYYGENQLYREIHSYPLDKIEYNFPLGATSPEVEIVLLAKETDFNEKNLNDQESLKTDPLTESVLKGIKNSHQKNRLKGLIRAMNNTHFISGIRFLGQSTLITSLLVGVGHNDLIPSLMKGVIGGGFSYLVGILDMKYNVYQYVDHRRESRIKKIKEIETKIALLENENTLTDISSIAVQSEKIKFENERAKLLSQQTSPLQNTLDTASFSFFYSLMEAGFLGSIFSTQLGLSVLINGVSTFAFGVPFLDVPEFPGLINWLESIILATLTQGAWDQQVSRFDAEIKKTNMSPEQRQALYNTLRIFGSLLSVTSSILAHSGAYLAGGIGFGVLLAATYAISKRTQKLKQAQLLVNLPVVKPQAPNRQCIGYY